MKRDLPLVPPRKVIPVIFVPGIMESNLKTKTAQEGTARAAYAKSKQEYSQILEFYQKATLKGSDGEERRWVELSYPDLDIKSQLEVARARQSNIPAVAVPNATQSFHCLMSHKGPDGSGDGTVPATSGVAPGQHGVSRIYRLQGFEHQGAHEHVAAQGATFFAIVDMVKRL